MGIHMDVDLDFKTAFYNLQGIHLNERKMNFYKLLKSTSLKIPQDQIDIQPRNYQETIFYVDVLIYFKKVDKLIDILKEGIGILTSKILKQRWFFQEAFKDMSEEDIINSFLPTLSYSLRMKVLKKLSLTLSEARMDKIFDLVLERYGLFIAKQFLFSCSPEKIIHVLRNNEITLLSEELKRLLQKDVNLLKVYFEEYKKNNRNEYNDWNFLSYLVWKHPDLYFDLGLNSKSYIRLGHNTTRAVIKTNKEDVLSDIQNYKWNKTAIVKEIKEFDKEYLFRFYPAHDMNAINQRSDILESFVRKYPIKRQWEVLSQTFKQAYNTEIVEHLDKFNERLAKFFPQEIKQKWAEIKYLENDGLQYIRYCNPQKAFKLLKEKIKVTSDIYQRGQFLNYLISVCHRYKDYSTYEEVLKYICIRHRNEDRNIRANMISYISRHIDYAHITNDHWKYINEMIDIQRIRDESLSFEIVAEYLLFVYLKEYPLDEPVRKYAEDCIKAHRSFRILPGRKAAERKILTRIVKILPTLQLENKRDVMYKIMSDIVDFNKDLRNDKSLNKNFDTLWIDLNESAPIMDLIKEVCTKKEPYNSDDYNVLERVICYNCLYSKNPLQVIDEDGFFDILDKGDYTLQHCLLDVITKPRINNFQNILLDYFFKNIEEKYSRSVKQHAINHFLAKEPKVITKYFSLILSLDIKYGFSMLDYDIIKKYSHLGWDERLIANFKDLASVNNKCNEKVRLIDALSTVMNTKDFLDLVKDYIPVVKKIDLDNLEQRKMYKMQCDIVKTFKNLNEPSLLAPVLMHFCQGDYLQSSLASLYSVLYRINEEKSSFYINELSLRAVSIRKHAVFFGFELLPLQDSMAIYSVLSKKETNMSAKKYLFNAVLKYFFKNHLESILDIVFLNMDFIDKNDTEMIQRLVESVNRITNKDSLLFIEKVWHLLDNLEQKRVKVMGYRGILLNFINNRGVSFVLSVKKNFCENAIKKYFLSSGDRGLNSSTMDYFVINYLLAYLDERHFEFVFNIIKSYKDVHWKSNDKYKKGYIFSFFSHVYGKFDENDSKFLKLFDSFWQRVFNHEECFSEYILLRLMVLYKENANIEVFSQEVDNFFQELREAYGPCIGEFFNNSVKRFFSNISTQHNSDFNLGNFAFYLLKSNSNEFNNFTVFSIIKNFKTADQNEIFLKVFDALKAVDNCTARICCNVLVKD